MFKFSSVGKLGYNKLIREYKSPSDQNQDIQQGIKKSKISKVQPSLPHSCYNILTSLIEPNLNKEEVNTDKNGVFDRRPNTTRLTPKPPKVSYYFPFSRFWFFLGSAEKMEYKFTSKSGR